jgi:hypothetical protein
MKLTGIIKALTVGLAVLGCCLPQPLLAATGVGSGPVVVDVRLQRGPEGNVLVGQVLSPRGLIQANVPVSLYVGKQKVGAGKTDAKGSFAFSGLRGGLYQVVTAGGRGAYRVWVPGTAPPSARSRAVVIAGEGMVRWQFSGGLKYWLANPWVIGAVVAVAVAVPVAIHNANHDDEPASP